MKKARRPADHFEVAAAKLAQDGELVDRVKDRLREVTTTVASAERIRTCVAGLLA